MKVILISGKAQHGKDTTAMLIKSRLVKDGNSVLITHYGDLVKYICKEFFNWNGKKDIAGRFLLQRVGTDVVREVYPDFWVEFIYKILKCFPKAWDYVLIPDCRFPNEISMISDGELDTTHLRVVRENFESPLTEEQRNHPSETALDNSVPDYVVINNGSIKDLGLKLEKWIEENLYAEH